MKFKTILASGAVVAFLGAAVCVQAQPNLNGTLAPSFYGSALAVQTINTGFGNSTYAGEDSDVPDANGSELDAAYGNIVGGNLYLFLAGDYEANGNHLDIFFGGNGGSQNTLNISGGWTASAMNGSVFSPGYNAAYLLDVNDYDGTLYADQYVLSASGSANTYLGSVTLSSGIGNGTLSGITLALNNSHVSTMGASGAALSGSTSGANTTTGFELEISLATLGISGPVEVLAAINGGGDGYFSNQFLPGLGVGTGNLATATFNFGSTPDEYFTVVPEPSLMAMFGLSGLVTLLALRRRK